MERVASPAPYGKILGALEAGIVLFCFGSGVLIARTRFQSQSSDGFTVLGTLEITGNTTGKLGTVVAG